MNNVIHTKLDTNGRILIPFAFRNNLHLKAGDDVILHLKPQSIEITTKEQSLANLQKLIQQNCKNDISLADELIAIRRDEAKNEK